VVVGRYPLPPGGETQTYRPFVAALDGHGELLWFKAWAPFRRDYFVYFAFIQPAAQGGFWLGGAIHQDPYQEWSMSPLLVRLSEEGEILEQRIYHVEGSAFSGAFRICVPLDDGGFLLSGTARDIPMDWPSALLVRMDARGAVQWARIVDDFKVPPPYPFGSAQAFKADGGFFLATPSSGFLRVGGDGRLEGDCDELWIPARLTAEEKDWLVAAPERILARHDLLVAPCSDPPSGNLVFKEPVEVLSRCGDLFPGILKVAKGSDPFRLKVQGWNFMAGSKVLVNGTEAPKTTFKRQDRHGLATLVASGPGLKALVPKGEAVTITVLNPDGYRSVGFTYVR